jgi:hypothetical protein
VFLYCVVVFLYCVCVLFVCNMCCLSVVFCTTATGLKTNCKLTNIYKTDDNSKQVIIFMEKEEKAL